MYINGKWIISDEEYQELMKFRNFAQKVWFEVGPYGEITKGSNLSTELRYEMQDLFNFDDSE